MITFLQVFHVYRVQFAKVGIIFEKGLHVWFLIDTRDCL